MKEHAFIVYTILTSGLFDVGDHVCHEIVRITSGQHGGLRGGLWFPLLITQL